MPSAAKGLAGSAGACDPSQQAQVWWPSFLLFALSGVAWVGSIPLLMVFLGGSMAPHVGWPAGVISAFLIFCVLVQVDQRLATAVVFLGSFGSAALAGQRITWGFAAAATAMVMLNGIKRVCRYIPQVMDLQCRLYRRYHKSAELGGALDSVSPGKSFFACHPHGVLSVGWISNVVWNRRFHHTAGKCFYLIDKTLRNKGLLARVWCDAYEGPHGGFRDNTRGTLQALMARGESVCMIPGAYQEATLFTYGRERVAISNRRGFVKYCLQYGYRLHPVYTFGEAETYYTVGGAEELRLWLNNWGIPTVAFWGLSWCPLLPRRGVELRTFVGPPLELPQLDAPTAEQVNEWHQKYILRLTELFDRHKAEAGKPDAVLEVH